MKQLKQMQMKKIWKKAVNAQPKTFSLTKSADRIALLCGITAGTVSRAEVTTAILNDTEKRPYRKPVVANFIRYPSITAAAEALCSGCDTWYNYTSNDLSAMRKHITHLCNKDDVPGYYWAE